MAGDGGHGSNGHGTLEQRFTGLDERVRYVEAGLPRIEQVQGEVIRESAKLREHSAQLAGHNDKVNHLASVTAQRFEQLGRSFDSILLRQGEQLARLEAAVAKLSKPSPKRRARR